jgi:hypothetical protein
MRWAITAHAGSRFPGSPQPEAHHRKACRSSSLRIPRSCDPSAVMTPCFYHLRQLRCAVEVIGSPHSQAAFYQWRRAPDGFSATQAGNCSSPPAPVRTSRCVKLRTGRRAMGEASSVKVDRGGSSGTARLPVGWSPASPMPAEQPPSKFKNTSTHTGVLIIEASRRILQYSGNGVTELLTGYPVVGHSRSESSSPGVSGEPVRPKDHRIYRNPIRSRVWAKP